MAPVGILFADGAILPGGTAEGRLQDRGDGVPVLPGSRGKGRLILHLDYYRRGGGI